MCDNNLGIFLLWNSQIKPWLLISSRETIWSQQIKLVYSITIFIPKSKNFLRETRFRPLTQLVCRSVTGQQHYFEWLHSACEEAKRGQEELSQQRPAHISVLVTGKQGEKHFTSPRSISAPAFLHLCTIGSPCAISISVSALKITTLPPRWLQPFKQLDSTAPWLISPPMDDIVSCRGFADLKMSAKADGDAGDGQPKTVRMWDEPFCWTAQLSARYKRRGRGGSAAEHEWG